MMKRRLSVALATCGALCAGALALFGGSASAASVQLGDTATPVAAPHCLKGDSPTACRIILTHTTAVPAMSDGIVNPTRVNQEGWVVGFSVGLSRLSSNDKTATGFIGGLNTTYGGDPELQLTVLKPGPKNTFTVAAESPVFPVLPYLGRVFNTPLSAPPKFSALTALHVVRGEVLGLTVPTWAPVLGYGLAKDQFAYRQSRAANCSHPVKVGQTAQTKVNQTAQYQCYYTGTRVEFNATELTDVKPPRTYVGKPTTK